MISSTGTAAAGPAPDAQSQQTPAAGPELAAGRPVSTEDRCQRQGQSDFIASVQFFLPAESGCLVDEFGIDHSSSDVLH
ncbi:hypothetical protein R3Q06_34395 [Rhodococcus erythropolis]|uniref:hypothetical protein n=1 Tax=Rhodococcus erythropolis TaxID=1833 RepID=UPI002949FDE6|nr:hypothetical protein [Rhodococcus erythropolis]MDV6278498.1 hypothetical protein [Rhodococcus erythropolis]